LIVVQVIVIHQIRVVVIFILEEVEEFNFNLFKGTAEKMTNLILILPVFKIDPTKVITKNYLRNL